MSEELIQRNLIDAPEKIGDWNFYNIGSTTLSALKNAKIIPNHNYNDFEKKKPDALIVKKPIVIAAIEYKTPQELKTEKQIASAITQELGTARALEARVYIVTDGKKTIWINPITGNEILQEDGSKANLNFNKNDPKCIDLINKIRASINSNNDQLKAVAPIDPLPLAKEVWQDLWAVSGATPENCLYTFVEVFIFKYLSDLGILKGLYSFYELLSKYETNSDENVLGMYVQVIRPYIKELFPKNEKDGTTIINGTIFVSKDDKAVSGYATVFHNILNKFNKFGILDNIDYDFKSKLFETFLKESISKKNWGQFFTPLKVVRSIVDMADVSVGMEICDPACGVGKFLLELVLNNLNKFFKIEPDENGKQKLVPQIMLSGFDKGFDKDEQKTIILAKANMLIYMSGMIREHPDLTKEFAREFNNTFLLQTNSILGTLAKPIKEKFDLILTNPPYVMSGSSNLKEEIAKDLTLKNHYSVNAMGIEGLFMEWIINALKPNGKAFVVVPDGIMNRSNDKNLRNFILEKCNIDAVISLPLNTFFTTNKKTYILALTKKEAVSVDGTPTLIKQDTPVFTYFCSEIGESRDNYRFEIPQNDLETAAELFNMFKGSNRKKFKVDDKRCKIVDIDAFYAGEHWSVERWWSREEKIELGIEEEKKAISLSEFTTLISDVSSSILEFQKPLYELDKKKILTSFKTIKLVDDNLFCLFSNGIGKNRTNLNSLDTGSSEDIPVYTAAEFPIAYIKEIKKKPPIYANATAPLLSFATNGDGSAGKNFVIHEKPFYINRDRIVVKPVREDLDIHYIRAKLNDMKEVYGFNHANKANIHNLSVVKFDIPVNPDGTFNLEQQNVIAEISNYLEELCNTIKIQKKIILDLNVMLDLSDYCFASKKVCDLFDIVKGKAKYTKEYGNSHQGPYPVYSASSKDILTYLDTFDYDGCYISWSTNGFAGTMLVLDGKFSINGDRGILLPKDNRTDLDFDYMKFTLEPVFREIAKGRKGDNGEDEFTKLYPSMINDVQIPVPVDENGEIDIEAQKEIAEKYLAIEQCKNEIVSKLNIIIEKAVSVYWVTSKNNSKLNSSPELRFEES